MIKGHFDYRRMVILSAATGVRISKDEAIDLCLTGNPLKSFGFTNRWWNLFRCLDYFG